MLDRLMPHGYGVHYTVLDGEWGEGRWCSIGVKVGVGLRVRVGIKVGDFVVLLLLG